MESAVVNLSFIATTLPRIHGYLVGLQAGLMRIDVTDEERRNYSLQRSAHSAKNAKPNIQSTEAPVKPANQYANRDPHTMHPYGPESACRAGDTHFHDDRRSSADYHTEGNSSSQASLRQHVVYQMQDFPAAAEHSGRPWPLYD